MDYIFQFDSNTNSMSNEKLKQLSVLDIISHKQPAINAEVAAKKSQVDHSTTQRYSP